MNKQIELERAYESQKYYGNYLVVDAMALADYGVHTISIVYDYIDTKEMAKEMCIGATFLRGQPAVTLYRSGTTYRIPRWNPSNESLSMLENAKYLNHRMREQKRMLNEIFHK